MTGTWTRLTQHWVYGGSCAGILLLALLPVIGSSWPLPLILVYLQLPLYMLHQFEEHDNDRFRLALNQMFAGGANVLPSEAVFLINVPGVWGLNFVAFWLAASINIGWGVIGIYTTLANALVHIIPAIVTRKYNPGSVTAVVLFLPAGIAGAWAVNAMGMVTPTQQVVAVVIAIGIHLAIQAYVRANVRRLSVPASPSPLRGGTKGGGK